MRHDLGAAVPREPRAPMGAILWLTLVSVGGLLSATSMLCLFLAMLSVAS